MIILGLSGLPNAQQYHLATNPDLEPGDERICQGMDSAACLVVDGVIVAAAAEERFTAAKATGAFPRHAMEYCLAAAGVLQSDVDCIAHGFNYDDYRRFFAHDEAYFDAALSGQTVKDELTRSGWSDVDDRFRAVDHHLAHAASSFLASGFSSGLAIVSDGMGEIDAITVFAMSGHEHRRLHRQGIQDSLGIAYSIITRYLGFVFNSDEYKVMGLSAYGDAERFAGFFQDFLRVESGRVRIAWPPDALHSPAAGYPNAMTFLEQELGVERRTREQALEPVHADIAAAFQRRFAEVLVEFVDWWVRETGSDSVCFAGGTFLNCLANQRLGQIPSVERMFIPPASGDDGTAIGAALHVAGTMTADYSPYTGPSYDQDQIADSIERHDPDGSRLSVERLGDVDEYYSTAASDIADDRIIAWFNGRMEFGPRALGNRSILALPGGKDIKDRLNRVIKQRESFRPFAPAVLEEDYEQIFEEPFRYPALFMLMTATVRHGWRQQLDGAVHVDGTARVQVVRRTDNEPFWKLLSAVKVRTGVGCVINTSFNVKDQPIIVNPTTALAGLEAMSLDRLYINGHRVTPSPTN